MKKYIIIISGILVSTHTPAESYVFGGKAHFEGVLINQSCSILVENNTSVSIKTPNTPVQINFSMCSVSTYDNIGIGLSKHNQSVREFFYTDAKTKINLNSNKKIELESSLRPNSNQKMIHKIDLPKHYDHFSKNSIAIRLNPESENTYDQKSNFLISIFYP